MFDILLDFANLTDFASQHILCQLVPILALARENCQSPVYRNTTLGYLGGDSLGEVFI